MNESLQDNSEPPSNNNLGLIEIQLGTSVTEEIPFSKTEIPSSDFDIINPATSVFRQQFFTAATDKQWNSWRWQIQNSYSSF
ncbi:hypothetical protein KJ633_03655, partial [bacterium]|nr:hypothetical protein [bacterium]